MAKPESPTTHGVTIAARRTRRIQDGTPIVASSRVGRATFAPGDFGRVIQPDGTEQWWVRSASGAWIALTHQRVMENDDGTITLLYLK